MDAVSGVEDTPAELGPFSGNRDVRSLRDAEEETDRSPRLLGPIEELVLTVWIVFVEEAIEGATEGATEGLLPVGVVFRSRDPPGAEGMGSAGGGGGASMYVGVLGETGGETDGM